MDPNNGYRNSADEEYLQRATERLVNASEFGTNEEFIQQIHRYAPEWIVHRVPDYSARLNNTHGFRDNWVKLCEKIQKDLSMEREELMKKYPGKTFTPINIEPQEILIVKRSPIKLFQEDETLLRWVVEELTKKGYMVRNQHEFTVRGNRAVFSRDFSELYG